jgi:3-phenylpropionate/trans-cinnamate dioxygenase ferredoxin reductase subunit
METSGIVIVGAGLCGATAARTLRAEGYGGPISLVGAETHLPYLRPPLSKGFLTGSEDAAALQVAPHEDYVRSDIHLLLGERVRAVIPSEQRVILANGRSLPYADLLLATGASSRALPLPGGPLEGVRYLRTLDDARALRAELAVPSREPARRLVILGAGWIGMEVAASARGLGAAVTVVAPDAIPLATALGPQIGRLFLRRHEAAGVEFRMSSRTAELLGREGRVRGVRLESGEEIAADAVLIAVGAVPNTELAVAAGLATDNGILVDQLLRTSAEHIYAAGDVATPYDPVLGRHQRSEHWKNAITSGEAAARSMLGSGNGLEAIPYFYTDQFDIAMEYSGYPSLAASARLVFRGDPDSGAYVAFWVVPGDEDTGVVVAGMNVNVRRMQKEIRALISSRTPVSIGDLSQAAAAVAP